MNALEGVRVLDLGHGIAGPFAARLLGDLGADVAKVERPGTGDFVRSLGPFATDDAGARTSALHELLNWNKRSVVIDLHEPGGREQARRLAASVDIVIASLRPRTLERWHLDGASLRAATPGLVVTTVSNFGATGPYRDWLGSDLIFHAMSGVGKISGNSDRSPIKRGLRQSLWCAGINAAYASLAAYLGAQHSGVGANVDLAIRDCQASELVLNHAFYMCMGAVQGRRPPARDPLGGPLGGGDPVPVRGGHVALQATPQVPVACIAKLLEEPRLAAPHFATSEGRLANASEVAALISARLADVDGLEFFERASRQGLLCGLVRDAAQLLACRQLEARGALRTVPGIGGLRFPAVLANLSRTPVAIRRRAAALGEHTDELLEAPARRALAPSEGGAPDGGGGPLAGLRVLDLSYVFAAPYIGGLLADLGAEVIKIEAPTRLDQSRTSFSPFFENDPDGTWWDRAGAFHVVNRGKRSLSLDLSRPAGRDVLLELVANSDVLLENYTPRVMRGWGLTYERLRQVNPRLVMLSNTGYGTTGPWAAFRAQGTTLEATMGLSYYAGYADGPPAKVGQSYPDFLACWSGLLALLAALIHRNRTGDGQWIDLGMYQLGPIVIPEALLRRQLTGDDEPRDASREPDAIFSAIVPAAGQDCWLAVTAFDDTQVAALRETVAMRVGNELGDALAEWSRSRDATESACILQAAGVPAGPVLDARGLLEDPQLRHRRFYEPAGCDDGVWRPLIGRPYRWSGGTTEVGVRGCGPRFGEAATWVLGGLLGLDAARIATIRSAGVVTDAPVAPSPMPPLDVGVMLSVGALARVDNDYQAVLKAVITDNSANSGSPMRVANTTRAATADGRSKVRSGGD